MPLIERREFPGGVIGYCTATGRGTHWRVWCYRIGDILIDTGCTNGLPGLITALRKDGLLRQVFVTHHHEDHSGNADAIRAATGARLVVTRFAEPLIRHGFPTRHYQQVMWGPFQRWQPDLVLNVPELGEMPLPDSDLRILHTPGHSHDMCTVYDPTTESAISADLFLARRLRYVRRDEQLPEVERSLARLRKSCAIRHVLCAHNPILEEGDSALAAKQRFIREARETLFARLHEGQPWRDAVYEVCGPENRAIRLFTRNDVSVDNLARSLLGEAPPRRSVVRAVGRRLACQDFG